MERETIELPGGGTIELETGKIARQAHGAVVLRHGDTVLLATAVAADAAKPGQDFFPLTVEYRERLAAGGRIPGSFQRREGRITDHEVLTSRLADRSVRPQFPEHFLNETQVLLTVLSADGGVDPEALAITAASAALHVSDIPWDGPLGGVRIARVLGEWRLFPTRAERASADLDLTVASGARGLVMVEGQGREASEAQVLDALARGEAACRAIAAGIARLAARAGKPKRPLAPPAADPAIAAAVREAAGAALDAALGETVKRTRRDGVAEARRAALAPFAGDPAAEREAAAAFEDLVYHAMRGRILDRGARLDGRGPADIRPIACEAGWLPSNHGSAVFTRGETQALVSCTLGTAQDEQRVEGLDGLRSERFLLHYNFPPSSVGEVRALRGPGRREIGHGNLAHRALAALLPGVEEFPYTIRLVSDIAESNGSSSMATVCGGCLALMDAGVPLARPVAGIAMGLVGDGTRTVVLSDILGDEDHLGDMDFKVAGTEQGITAIQMDNKLGALPEGLMAGALEQARAGRVHILGEMAKERAAPRPELSPRAPRVVSLRIRREMIRDLIGPGGRNIQEIQQATGVKVDIADDGLVRVYSHDAAGAAEALRRIRRSTFEPQVGGVYRGEVVLVRDFFAIVKLSPAVEGKLHVSELDNHRVAKVGDVLSPGQDVVVKVLGVDKQGKIELSRRQALGEDPL